MPRTDLWLRLFVGLLLAVIPPILLLVGSVLLGEGLLAAADPNLLAVGVVVAAVIWAAVLSIAFSRLIGEDIRSIVELAERGEAESAPDFGGEHLRLVAALDERNRQVTTLAREAGAVRIDDEPTHVVRSLVAAARSVTRDATWHCAVLDSLDPRVLPPGRYGGREEPRESTPIGDLERWAASSAGEEAVRVDGPWGAFVVVGLSNTDRLRAVLFAPWEGRGDPSAAERAVLTLVGEHAGAAIEHSLLYTQVQRQADELHRMAGVQADFLRGVTHDLQTPLTSIAALASELQASPELSATSRSDLDLIGHQADRLRRMVSQLLVASRLEAGVVTPRLDVFGVRPLVERTWAALRADRPFEIVERGGPQLAVGDPDRLEQVLWAVLDNAVKYSPEDSAVSVTVEEEDDRRLRISVADAGMGMDAETARHVFEQFFRAPAARAAVPDGSGIGLYAARGLMEVMGGSVEVVSRLGRGTTVLLRMPAESIQSET